ncbi:hypothetical protein EON65_46605 [archaeon]|nr:MAG: hypothetical protein EON65_46605 [archaeon]
MGSFSGSRDGGCFPFELTHEDDDGFLANYTFASLLTSYPKEYYFLEANCSQDMLIGDDRLPPLVHSCTISNDDDDDAGDDDDVFESTSWISYKSSLTCTLPQTTDCSPIGDDDLTDSDYAVAAVGAAAGVVVIGIGIFFMSKAGYFGVSMHHATNQPRTPDLDISSEL